MSILNIETFEVTSIEHDEVLGKIEHGTIEATLRRETRQVPASRYQDGTISATGMTGRYRTGTKAWPAVVEYRSFGQVNPKWGESVWFGRDDRADGFQKTHGLSFSNEVSA